MRYEAPASFTAVCCPLTSSPRRQSEAPPRSVVAAAAAAKAMYVGRACVGAAKPWQPGSEGQHPAVSTLPVSRPMQSPHTTTTSRGRDGSGIWIYAARKLLMQLAVISARSVRAAPSVAYTLDDRRSSRTVTVPTINICCPPQTLYTVTSTELSAIKLLLPLWTQSLLSTSLRLSPVDIQRVATQGINIISLVPSLLSLSPACHICTQDNGSASTRDVVLGTCTCTRVQLEYRFQVLVLVLVLEGW